MIIWYAKISIILISIALNIKSFSMDQITTISFCHFPKEINQHIFTLFGFACQDRMRATCRYWKKIGDERTSQIYLLNLLHNSPSNTTEETKTRILFDAVYHKNYDLVETVLKSVPKNNRLYYKTDNGAFNPYHVAYRINDDSMLTLLKNYRYYWSDYSYGIAKLEPKFNEFPKSDILFQLLVSSIVGDSISIETIITVDLKNPDIRKELYKRNKEELSRDTRTYIKQAFKIITQNDDHESIASLKDFLKDNPKKLDWWFDELFNTVHTFKSKKVFKSLLQQYPNLNKIELASYNGNTRFITLKNMILGINWPSEIAKDSDYYQEIEEIMNECCAKTYEELI